MSPPQFRTRRKDGTFQLYEFEYRPRGRGLDGSYLRPYLLFVQYWGVNELVQARSSLQLTLSSCSGEVDYITPRTYTTRIYQLGT